MDYFEVEIVGRELVKSVNATLLANITSDLVKKYEKQNNKKNKYLIRCKDKLEFLRKLRKNEDEGFESENDSVISNEDSYLVDDHVLKRSVGSTDSANSSGSSDTDEVDCNLLIRNDTKEEFNITDVIFCHTEARFPNTIAWVVKKNLNQTEYRLCKTGVENIKNGLEVIVVKCRNNENLREICFNYKENSRRYKLDKGYRKTVSLTEKKVSLDDIKVTSSTLIKSSLLNITNKTINVDHHRLTSSVSLNSLLHDKRDELSKASSLSNVSIKHGKPNITKYNLVQRTDNGVTHIEILHDSKSKLRKEIEGIIVTDVDIIKKDQVRQQESETPPIRPERRRYIRKKDSINENLPEPKPISKTYGKVDTVNGGLGSWKNEKEIKKRSKSVDRLRILPKKAPMAYRYIDIADKGGGGFHKDQRRRRNSLDELVIKNSKPDVNLKSVIKKNKKNKNSEPKKVTFSAFATVQVVD